MTVGLWRLKNGSTSQLLQRGATANHLFAAEWIIRRSSRALQVDEESFAMKGTRQTLDACVLSLLQESEVSCKPDGRSKEHFIKL